MSFVVGCDCGSEPYGQRIASCPHEDGIGHQVGHTQIVYLASGVEFAFERQQFDIYTRIANYRLDDVWRFSDDERATWQLETHQLQEYFQDAASMPYPVQRRWQQFLDRDWGWEGTDSLTYRDLLNTQPEQVTLDVILICAYSESTERPIEYFP